MFREVERVEKGLEKRLKISASLNTQPSKPFSTLSTE
jgi:hypothetical protein